MPRRTRRQPEADPPTPDTIVAFFLDAYRIGAFPMADMPSTRPVDPDASELPVARRVRWYQPDPRAILPLEDGALHIPRSLSRRLKRAGFITTSDAAFEAVIRGCARPGPTRGGAWLDESLVRCYTLLHQRGHAHSIEVWRDTPSPGSTRMLVGGIYGVSIGGAFFAESMFSRLDLDGSGASGLALITLWNHLRACGYTLLDVQIANEHTLRFGVRELPHAEYARSLAGAVDAPDRWKPLSL